jgi:hypothetical protein
VNETSRPEGGPPRATRTLAGDCVLELALDEPLVWVAENHAEDAA